MDNEQQIKKEYDNISNKLLSENPVCKLSGEEFSPIEGKTLKQQVIDYFNICGNSASTQFGNVLFDEKGIKNALHHGMSRTKAIAFAAIKPTLENGTIILPLDYYNVHGKKQKTGMIAAPIIIKEEKYICVVEVIDNTITNRLYAHEVFLTKNLIEDVADTIAVLGAETPVTHPQGEVAKILKNYIQNAYSKEEILDYLNNVQSVDNEGDKKFQTNNDNNNDNKHPKINESSCINNNRKIYKTNMTHIKRIDEMKNHSRKINESLGNDSFSNFFLSGCLGMYESDLNKFDELCPDLDYGEEEFESAMSSLGINDVSDITNAYYQSIFDTYVRDLVENQDVTSEEAEQIVLSTRPLEFYYDGEEFSTTEELLELIQRKRAE